MRQLAARRGQDAAAFVLSLVDEAVLFDGFEPTDPNDPEEQAEAVAAIQRGLDDFAAGRHKPHAQIVAEARVLRVRHGAQQRLG